MPRLQWEQVAAPNLSIRDMAIASSQVTAGFERLGKVLEERYLQKKQEDTNAAVAGILAESDPNKLMSVDPASFGKNVDTRAVMEALVQQRRGLLVEADTREDLLNKQALSKHGDELQGLFQAYRDGDEAAKAQMVTRAAEDPEGFGRAASAFTLEFFNAAVGGEEFRQDQLEHKDLQEDRAIGRQLESRRISQEDERIALSRESTNLAKADRADLTSGAAYGHAALEKYGTLGKDAGLDALYNDPTFKAASPIFQEAARKVFSDRQEPVAAQALARIEAENRPAADAATPVLREMAERSRKYTAEGITSETVVGTLLDRGPYMEKGEAQAGLRKIMGAVPGATPADIQAVIDTQGFQANFIANKLGGEWGSWEDDRLLEGVRKMVAERDRQNAAAAKARAELARRARAARGD